ncbi:hypothetical protein [Candidatus Amarobacter glycogenicus]|uniref:hypothetical protein n=1 Tax=Candidatus Amarobacter glycogenicus TaxID=3140699 RepID=UPI002A13A0E3|nr:hypothetical protein [Dehalococcoidia bacterium]
MLVFWLTETVAIPFVASPPRASARADRGNGDIAGGRMERIGCLLTPARRMTRDRRPLSHRAAAAEPPAALVGRRRRQTDLPLRRHRAAAGRTGARQLFNDLSHEPGTPLAPS